MFAPPMVCICRGTDGRIGIDHPFRVWALVQQETKTIAFSLSVFSFLYLLDDMVLQCPRVCTVPNRSVGAALRNNNYTYSSNLHIHVAGHVLRKNLL